MKKKLRKSWIWEDELPIKSREGCTSCARYALLVLNVLFFAGGIIVALFGAWLRFYQANWNLMIFGTSHDTLQSVAGMARLAIIAGSTTVVIALMGCRGALTNNKFILALFSFFIVINFVIIVVVSGLSIWLHIKIKTDLDYQLKTTFIRHYQGDAGKNIESVAWNHIQSDLSCCGVNMKNGYKDYKTLNVGVKEDGAIIQGAAYWRSQNQSTKVWPDSCCAKDEKGNYVDLTTCRTKISSGDSRHKVGCEEKVRILLRDRMIDITALAITLALTECAIFFIVRILESGMVDDDDSVITQFSAESIQIMSVSSNL